MWILCFGIFNSVTLNPHFCSRELGNIQLEIEMWFAFMGLDVVLSANVKDRSWWVVVFKEYKVSGNCGPLRNCSENWKKNFVETECGGRQSRPDNRSIIWTPEDRRNCEAVTRGTKNFHRPFLVLLRGTFPFYLTETVFGHLEYLGYQFFVILELFLVFGVKFRKLWGISEYP